MRGCWQASLLVIAPFAAWTQTRFEVASIKPAAPLTPAEMKSANFHLGLKADPGRVDIRFWGLAQLIAQAYRVEPYQISGPEWLLHPAPFESRMFDIEATFPKGASKSQVPEMLQSLLAERFKLTVHREQKSVPVYALVVGDKAVQFPKSTESDAESDLQATPIGAAPGRAAPAVVISGPYGTMKIIQHEERSHIEFANLTFTQLAKMLSGLCDRPVVDDTGLAGTYAITLDLPSSGPTPTNPSGHMDLVLAGLSKAGLKLEKRTGSVEYLIVDRLERGPTEN